MKLTLQASLLAGMAFNAVNACWQVHTYFQGDPFAGDILSMQAKDNDVERCTGGQTIYLSSGDTTWTITCDSLTFTFTDNGRSGHVSGVWFPAQNFSKVSLQVPELTV